VGANTITTLVTASDGTTTDTYTITVTRVASANANIVLLRISSGTLSPTFAQATTSYAASVTNAVSSITVTPTANDAANATITVNGTNVASGTASGAIALSVGDNTITAVCTAQNGPTTKTYTVVVTRAMAGMNSVYEPVSVVNPANTRQPANDIMVHQGLSPNGDGDNDFLVIDGISNYPDNELLIMSRTGDLVFEVSGYNNHSHVFDGHSNKNGKMQSPGTYFYSLDYKADGVARHKTGFIVLKY
jgi:gliding motility-associated-like protein